MILNQVGVFCCNRLFVSKMKWLWLLCLLFVMGAGGIESDLDYEDMHGDLDSNITALSKAVDYILSQRAENGWGALTSRAVIALSFVRRFDFVSEKQMSIAKKELDLQIFHDMMQKKTNLGSLALNINALLSTCQDPRNFGDFNLVQKLRTLVESAKEMARNTPAVYLTLCLAKDVKENDLTDVYNIYNSAGDKTALQALAFMALTCVSDALAYNLQSLRNHALQAFKIALNLELDIYSKALIIQAFNSANDLDGASELISHQHPDGSFGDTLSTYYAIPAILGTSLLSLADQCQSGKLEVSSRGLESKDNTTKTITYSLRITNEDDLDTHSLSISFNGNRTFYDIMNMASSRNSIYRFKYDEDQGKKIYSIADIPNDPETGKEWNLYFSRSDSSATYSKAQLKRIDLGVDKIYPESGSHFIFWLSKYCRTATC